MGDATEEMPNKPYYAWNDVELRDVEGGLDVGHLCNYCYCLIPAFHFDNHMEVMHADKS